MPFSRSPNKAEYRQEIFYPPFWFDMVNKPSIVSIFPQIIGYGQMFTIKYTGVTDPSVKVRGHKNAAVNSSSPSDLKV